MASPATAEAPVSIGEDGQDNGGGQHCAWICAPIGTDGSSKKSSSYGDYEKSAPRIF